MEVGQFVEKHFAEGSRPSRNTLMRWLQGGKLPGARKIGGTWYVDEAIFQSSPSTGNAIVDAQVSKILQGSSKHSAEVDAAVAKILRGSSKPK
ncbi:MAG: hypothetical protein JWR07_1167 [Nevskia sp.]|nr:hypothetical protein [Nevskia sp.]